MSGTGRGANGNGRDGARVAVISLHTSPRDQPGTGDSGGMNVYILEVAERMADRIGVIAKGRLVAEGTLTELRQQNGRNDTSLEDMFIALVDTEVAAA